jgi:hypothetical protein
LETWLGVVRDLALVKIKLQMPPRYFTDMREMLLALGFTARAPDCGAALA